MVCLRLKAKAEAEANFKRIAAAYKAGVELGHVLVLSKTVRSSLMQQSEESMTSRWPEMYRLRVVTSCLPSSIQVYGLQAAE